MNNAKNAAAKKLELKKIRREELEAVVGGATVATIPNLKSTLNTGLLDRFLSKRAMLGDVAGSW